MTGFLVAGACLPDALLCAQPREYAYLLIQGRIADPLDQAPLGQATLRLTSPGGTFEATTDENGVFVFDRLPVATYSLQVTARDGRVIRGVQEPDPDILGRARLEIRLGNGAAKEIVMTPRGESVGVEVPKPSTRSGRIWKQLLVFVGAAGILASAH